MSEIEAVFPVITALVNEIDKMALGASVWLIELDLQVEVYFMCGKSDTPAVDEASTVVSERGDILSPK